MDNNLAFNSPRDTSFHIISGIPETQSDFAINEQRNYSSLSYRKHRRKRHKTKQNRRQRKLDK